MRRQMAQGFGRKQPAAGIGQDVSQRHRPHAFGDDLWAVPADFGQPARDEDGGLRVEPTFAGQKSHRLGAVQPTEAVELLVGERFERSCVPGGPAGRQELADRLFGDPRLPASRGGGHQDIATAYGRQRRFLKRCRDERTGWWSPNILKDRAELAGSGAAHGLPRGGSEGGHVHSYDTVAFPPRPQTDKLSSSFFLAIAGSGPPVPGGSNATGKRRTVPPMA